MKEIINRIDKLTYICEGIYDYTAYNKVLFEIESLISEITGKESGIYNNYEAILASNISTCDKFHSFVGILNSLKNHINLSLKNKKYQVFISSTYMDLIEYRQAVSDEIYFKGHIPAGMEDFTACGEALDSYIKGVIDDSDYYVLLVGQRYGSEYKKDISYTQMEYNYAKEKGFCVIPFIYNGQESLSNGDKDINGSKLQKFIEEIGKNNVPQYFKDKGELIRKLNKALDAGFKKYPQKGWIRL